MAESTPGVRDNPADPITDSASTSGTAVQFTCPLCDQTCTTTHHYKQHQGSKKRATQTAKKKLAVSKNAVPPPATPASPRLAPQSRIRKKIMRRIPKNARYQTANAYSATLEDCARSNTPAAWAKLFAFASEVFALPPSRSDRNVSLTTHVKKNITAFESNQQPVLPNSKQTNKKKKSEQDELKRQINMRFNDGDISGIVRLLSSEDRMAPFTEETVQLLREKHPAAPDDTEYPEAPDDSNHHVPVTSGEIRAAVKSFHNGSAAGVDHLRPQHLKDMLGMLECETSKRLTRALAEVVQLMISGKVHEDVCPLLYGASLIALKKKDSGIRPIAVGHTLRRVAAKVVCNRVAVQMGEKLRPRQLGFGTPGGAEAAVHAARAFIGQTRPQVQIMLKLDFRNAFNCVNRGTLLRAVKKELPEYYPFLWSLYRRPSRLLFGDYELSSEWGVQQGDPLGPLSFCLTIAPLVNSLSSPLNLWYLDDATLGGNVNVVLDDLRRVMGAVNVYGLELNLDKCEAFIFGGNADERGRATLDLRQVSPLIRITPRESWELLGSPLIQEATRGVVSKKTEELKIMVGKLHILPCQQAVYLLRNCFSLPKLLYVLRTSPTYKTEETLREFDIVLRDAIQSVTNTLMKTKTWDQATLPVRQGGLGVRLAEELALSAYLGSICSVGSLLPHLLPGFDFNEMLREPLDMWTELTGCEPPSDDAARSQKSWDAPLVEKKVQKFRAGISDDPLEKARWLAVSSAESGKWLNALPALVLGTLLDDVKFCLAIRLRLGADTCIQHTCRCGQIVDQWGLHGLSCCQNSGTTIARHNAINEVLGSALATAQIPNRLEPAGLCRENRTRPDGMTLNAVSNGLPEAWDVTCVDTMAMSHVAETSVEAGKAAAAAEENKVQHYSHLSDQFVFRPVGFETMGSWGPAAKRFINTIGARLAEVTGEPRSLEFLKQRVSLEIQRGNAAAVMSTVPAQKMFDDVFFLTPRD